MMASSMENFMDMSLDEYIATKKNSLRNIDKESQGAVISPSNSLGCAFKAGHRNSKISNAANDYDEVMGEKSLSITNEDSPVNSSVLLDKSIGIWRGPSSETNYLDLDYIRDEFDQMFNDPELQISNEGKSLNVHKVKLPNDLRERLQNSNANNSSTIKEREKCHTGNAKNAIPTCQSKSNMDTKQNAMSFSSGNAHYRRRWYNNRNARRRNDGCGNRGSNYMNNESQNTNWNKHRNGGNGSGVCNGNILHFNNGRIHRFNQRNNQDNLNKRIKTVLEQINSNNSVYLNKQAGTVRDLTIECPSISTSGRLTTNVLQTTTQVLKPPTNQVQSDLKALLGVNDNNLKADTMAMWAGKLLELFQSGQQQTAHKPIYDMQIQKEIHELQGKSLLYKCPSGEIVSSDGSGIDNCKVTPNSSGVTLNYRFG
ncbi:homeobox protein 2 [Zeugodacus cucurbitae]|uniref:homeobox protein 2 n=1 Tax=Zeugodacus cucurbitae TaxID=28588 RepID=UPI0005967FCB|nr:homeobox protein 2 [Zeugodacus cucurbitae]